MKIKKFDQLNEKVEYYKYFNYDKDILDYLTNSYNLWLSAEGLPQLSADEFNINDLSEDQQTYIKAFIDFWNISDHFDNKFNDPNFLIKLKAKKYNII
jgi:hypothetical protein